MKSYTVLCRIAGRDHRLTIRAESHEPDGVDRVFLRGGGWVARIPLASIVGIRDTHPLQQ